MAPAIKECVTAGIRVVMITGDTQPTAEAIAKEIGIFGKGESLKNRSFTGAQFFALPEAERVRLLTSHHQSMAFSRTEPKDKQELVKRLPEPSQPLEVPSRSPLIPNLA